MDAERERTRVVDFYTEVVLPALAERLDQAFPEFGWRRDARGWVATNEEHTHARLGVRAERVVAHGPAPRGFLVHGGEPMLWTAYLAGGGLPRGAEFVRIVGELADRAGVDAAPLERETPRDRRTELFDEFFKLAQRELAGEGGETARAYLGARGFAREAIGASGLGVIPPFAVAERALHASGYSDEEVKASGLLADGRWSGRLSGAWRDERGRIGTFWARSLDDREPRYLYLRGAGRTHLPPYGLSDVLRLASHERRELVLVEGLVDVHHLRAKGIANVAAIGSARIQPDKLARLSRHGIETVTLALDNDESGREALARAIDQTSRLENAPALRVVDPVRFGDAKDPDEYVRAHGVDRFRELVRDAECAVTWRTVDRMRKLEPDSPERERRAALADVGKWLGALPPRLALEVDDAICAASERSGYDPKAVERAFHAKFWGGEAERRERQPALRSMRQLDHSIDL
jgi:Toprim-like